MSTPQCGHGAGVGRGCPGWSANTVTPPHARQVTRTVSKVHRSKWPVASRPCAFLSAVIRSSMLSHRPGQAEVAALDLRQPAVWMVEHEPFPLRVVDQRRPDLIEATKGVALYDEGRIEGHDTHQTMME